MERCDVFDETGRATGQVVTRGTTLHDGEYYLAVQIWIRDESGRYLVQQRALHLISGPGMWATTAGYVMAGETSIEGAVREVREELGFHLAPAALQHFMRVVGGNLLQDIWIASVSHDEIGDPVIGDEVNAWQWASKTELQEQIGRGTFFRYSYFEHLPE
jgi:8-oxo-dGTP diphosphatase